MKKKWTPQELIYLKDNWEVTPLDKIIIILNRTKDSIIRKAGRLNLDTRKKIEDKLVKNWDNIEDQFIIDNYGLISNKKISQVIGRSSTAIAKRAKVLKISNTLKRWTKSDMYYLEEKWGIISVEAIAKKINRSVDSVLLKAWHMDLRQQATSNGDYLNPPEISVITGIPLSTVYSHIRKNKIKHKKFRIKNRRKYQISPQSLLTFLEKYESDWNSYFADITQIKSYFSSYNIVSGEVVIKNNMPEWLTNKVIQEKAIFN